MPRLTQAARQHLVTSFTGREARALRGHSWAAQEGGQEVGGGPAYLPHPALAQGQHHIPALAGPLPSPKHGAVGEGAVLGGLSGHYIGELLPTSGVHRSSSCVVWPQACHRCLVPQFFHQ